MERTLGLRPWLVFCVLGFARTVTGCGPPGGDGSAVLVDAGPAIADVGPAIADAAEVVDAAVALGDFCLPDGGRCSAGSSCRRFDPWIYAHCTADGALAGGCREGSPACDPGLSCAGTGPTGRCVRALTSDAGRSAPWDAGTPAGCNPYDRSTCPADFTCAILQGVSMCVVRGTAAAPCRSDRSCDPNLICGSSTGTCVIPVAVGAGCSEYDATCAIGSSCTYDFDSTRPVCVADGARGGYCGGARASCVAGLRCVTSGYSTPRCRPTVALGGACDISVYVDSCMEGATCLTGAGGHRCVADGTEGGACAGAGCGPGLRCDARRCRRTVAFGDACGTLVVDGLCPEGSSCEGAATSGRCVVQGTRGGQCRSTAPMCDAGLECGGASSYSVGLCRRVADEGGACDVAQRTTVCAGTTFCAPDLSGATGTCAQPGAVAGAPCRRTSPRCSGGLECSSASSSAETCRRVEPIGAPCDVAQRTVVCSGLALCVRLDGAGVCALETPEVEPNDDAARAQGVTGNPVVIAGTVARDGADCFAVTTPSSASLLVIDEPVRYDDYLATSVTLLDAAGATLATGTGTTPTIDPARVPAARGLAAGRYVVCVRAIGTIDSAYRLTIAMTVPAP